MAPRTGTELVDQTIKLGLQTGWRVNHQRPARTTHGYRTAIQGHAGYPDLTLAKGGLVLFREGKSRWEKMSPDQWEWAYAMSGDPGWVERPDADPLERALWLFDIWRPIDMERLIVPLLTGRLAGIHAYI